MKKLYRTTEPNYEILKNKRSGLDNLLLLDKQLANNIMVTLVCEAGTERAMQILKEQNYIDEFVFHLFKFKIDEVEYEHYESIYNQLGKDIKISNEKASYERQRIITKQLCYTFFVFIILFITLNVLRAWIN